MLRYLGTALRFPFAPSLRRKIAVGYYATAAIILLASAVTFEELRSLEEKVSLGDRLSDLFDTTLEIRRFERNYFLHRQPGDYEENIRYVARTRELLERNQADFQSLDSPQSLAALKTLLDQYDAGMAEYVASGGDQAKENALEPRIRNLGKEIVGIAEEQAGAERRVVQSSLATFRTVLVVAIGGLAAFIVLLGQALSRSVVAPLKEMEASVDAISRGKLDSLAVPSRDRELVSIGNAFNHMLRELDLRQRHLLQSEKLASLGTMLSGVAHELNNPLSNISSSCQILMEELEGSDVDTQKMFLGQIDEQTLRARNIVRSLLDFARERDFRKETLPLRELVEQTVGFVRGEVPAKAAIGIAIPDDIAVLADKQRLQQAFLNLLKNALEALGETGSVTVTAEKRFVAPGDEGPAWAAGCTLEGEVVDIAVSDDGPGIAPEVLPRIFDPFFTTKDVGLGMGLGLFIVYEVVDEHGGWIAASSEPGKGTTFHIRLPQPSGWTA